MGCEVYCMLLRLKKKRVFELFQTQRNFETQCLRAMWPVQLPQSGLREADHLHHLPLCPRHALMTTCADPGLAKEKLEGKEC
jgi:hypothetical protein